MFSQLSVCAFLKSESLADFLQRSLQVDRFALISQDSEDNLIKHLQARENQTDCLILEDCPRLSDLIQELNHHKMLFPGVLILNTFSLESNPVTASAIIEPQTLISGDFTYRYHPAEVQVLDQHLMSASHGDPNPSTRLESIIDKAIVQFLQLSPLSGLTHKSILPVKFSPVHDSNILRQQQQRLADKLNERLGYLGVYYKRDPKQFLRNLPPEAAQELRQNLKQSYRKIVLEYFSPLEDLNTQVDNFVNLAFFADIPVTRIVEIHMELMDEFAQQLKLENRNEDILLDYRLTLIDTIAHLCELYRRSIPRDS
ncbi:MAG: circadian clock protein KaiA [Prochlorotrichaceae cyanobacterium]